MHRKLPQSTVKALLPSNESYESKTGCNRTLATVFWAPLTSGRERGSLRKGVFSLEESLESLESLDSLESLENGRILLYFPQSGVL